MATQPKATIEDLNRLPDTGKAEIINEELVLMAPAGSLPSRARLNIAASLRQYERRTETGYAFADNAGFRMNLPNRESSSPAAERALAEKRADY